LPHILIVDDDENTRSALTEIITAQGFTVAVAGSLKEATIQIGWRMPDVILTDLKLPDGTGMDIFQEVQSRDVVELIVMTGHASVDSAVDALRLGAADYLVKPINMQRLNALLDRVPRARDLKKEIGSLRDELRSFGHFGRMLGNAPVMQRLYDQIGKVAPTEATVLLIGESGTGKEVAAQTVHDLSLRRKRPFLAVNCGAISPNLIESEMFGHERGSFTGADRQHKGFFERAHGGTLFLDEITEMPIELQVKLLRVLETGNFMRVGTNREIETDVRVIAATNRDPEEAVAQGRLRADLYHRLNVFPLELPPLRERGNDVKLIAQSLLDQLNAAAGTAKQFTPDVLEAMVGQAWPGNVRELKNYVQRSYILADENWITATGSLPKVVAPSAPAHEPAVSIQVGMTLAHADRLMILATLEQCDGVKKAAAKMLGISLKTLYNRLEEFGAAGLLDEAAP
jgi:two-component system response regulator AtoC